MGALPTRLSQGNTLGDTRDDYPAQKHLVPRDNSQNQTGRFKGRKGTYNFDGALRKGVAYFGPLPASIKQTLVCPSENVLK